MSAFAAALASIHADANMGEVAEFRRPPGAWVAVRVIRAQPTDAFGGARAGTLHVTILAAAITVTPRREDEVRIAAIVYVVEDTDRDALGLSWLLTLADRN